MHTDGASNHPSRVPPNLPSSHQGTPQYSNLPVLENRLATEPSTPPSEEESYPLTSTSDPQLDTGDTTIATMDGRSLVAEGPDLDEETLVDEGKRDNMTEQPMSPQTFMTADKEMTSVEGDFIEAMEEEAFGQQMTGDYLEATEEREKATGSSTWEDEVLEATEERTKATGSSIKEDEDLETAEVHNQAEVASLDKTKTVADTFDIGGQTEGLEVGSDYIEAVEVEASGQQMIADFLEAAEEQLEAMRSSDSENKDMEADVTSLGKLETAVDALDARGQDRDHEVNPKEVGDKLDWLGREKAGILVEAVTSEDELYSAEPLEDGSGSRKQGPTFKEKFIITEH
jgi:hypothetical protein